MKKCNFTFFALYADGVLDLQVSQNAPQSPRFTAGPVAPEHSAVHSDAAQIGAAGASEQAPRLARKHDCIQQGKPTSRRVLLDSYIGRLCAPHMIATLAPAVGVRTHASPPGQGAEKRGNKG